MSTTEDRSGDASGTASAGSADTKPEVLVIPDSDDGRAKEFHGGLGWRLDADRAVGDDFRLIRFTPPGRPDWDAAYMVAEQAGTELPT